MSQRLYLLRAYREGWKAAQGWRDGTAIRCPYFWRPSKWMAWHAGFDRGLHCCLNHPRLPEKRGGRP